MSVRISVIVPVFNGAVHLEKCLEHLRNSSETDFELIVADDGSTDESPAVAHRSGAKVLRDDERRGPAHARNVAARKASGDVLLFVDADVCVQADTIERVRQAFQEDPELDALIGSYDDDPTEPDFLSQYRNLMHHYVHQTGHLEAGTFWSGCGAIRREVFLNLSGFDESFGRPAIEDIELGYRLRHAGRKLVLDKLLRVKHLKRWTFWNLVKTDIADRGIPWTELILRERNMPDDLNIQWSQRVSVALAFLVFSIATVAAIYRRGLLFTPLFALVFVVMGRYWFDLGGQRRFRWRLVVLAAGILAIAALAWEQRTPGLIPLVLLGFALLALRHRYSIPGSLGRAASSLALITYGCIAALFITIYLPWDPLMLVCFLGILGMVVLNNQFYLFLAAKRGRSFAIAAIPFHLLYHFYNGVSFIIGTVRFWLRGRQRN